MALSTYRRDFSPDAGYEFTFFLGYIPRRDSRNDQAVESVFLEEGILAALIDDFQLDNGSEAVSRLSKIEYDKIKDVYAKHPIVIQVLYYTAFPALCSRSCSSLLRHPLINTPPLHVTARIRQEGRLNFALNMPNTGIALGDGSEEFWSADGKCLLVNAKEEVHMHIWSVQRAPIRRARVYYVYFHRARVLDRLQDFR